MADTGTTKRSPTPVERTNPEDPETAAARQELDNTAISDKPKSAAMAASRDKPAGESTTPPPKEANLSAPGDDLTEHVSSPKKKRAHDEVEEPSSEAVEAVNGDNSPIGASGGARSDRLEPEKKRHRDISSEVKKGDIDKTESAEPASSTKEEAAGVASEKARDGPAEDSTKKAGATATSAFASSGLASFASSASPFLSGGSKPLSSFASASSSTSPFGTAAAASKPSSTSTPSVFGSSSASTNGASPFGQLSGSSKPFGSAFSSGFGSGMGGLSGGKLTSFGTPGGSLKSSKPMRQFGAPESEEDDDDDDGDEDAAENDNDDEKTQDGDEKEAVTDKKKSKLQKVVVDDGEAGEATLLQVRAKIYHLDKTTTPAAWKERGAGNLKINVPETTVDTDDTGAVIPGSFDASVLEDADNRTVRLVMRQDSTHKVILNTAVIPAMEFQEKPTNKALCVLFTAIEGEGAVSIQLKMSPANAKSFLNEVTKVQRELQLS